MTESDETRRKLAMPANYLPYLDKHKIYALFKDMLRDLLLELPRDHVTHMKRFLVNRLKAGKEVQKILLLVAPDVKFCKYDIAKQMREMLGVVAITRRQIMDIYARCALCFSPCSSTMHGGSCCRANVHVGNTPSCCRQWASRSVQRVPMRAGKFVA